jgi:hypothetical protein
VIAIVRTRTLRALRAGIAEAESAAAAARAEAETATDSAIRAENALDALRTVHGDITAEAARAQGELETLRAQALLDTEDRAVLRMLLRTARKSTGPKQVFVLLHRGQFHSVHESREGAEQAAERDGAHRDGWLTQGEPGTQRPDAEVLWRIRPIPLAGEAR